MPLCNRSPLTKFLAISFFAAFVFARALGELSLSVTQASFSADQRSSWMRFPPPPDHHSRVLPGVASSTVRPNQLSHAAWRPTSFFVARSTTYSECVLYPLVATTTRGSFLSGTMLSGRSVSGKCSPAGVSFQPLGSRKPSVVGPAYCGASALTGADCDSGC